MYYLLKRVFLNNLFAFLIGTSLEGSADDRHLDRINAVDWGFGIIVGSLR